MGQLRRIFGILRSSKIVKFFLFSPSKRLNNWQNNWRRTELSLDQRSCRINRRVGEVIEVIVQLVTQSLILTWIFYPILRHRYFSMLLEQVFNVNQYKPLLTIARSDSQRLSVLFCHLLSFFVWWLINIIFVDRGENTESHLELVHARFSTNTFSPVGKSS